MLIEAFRNLASDTDASRELIVVGDGPDRERLEKQASGGNIVFTGFLHGEDLARAYAAADVFVFPSATDTFGNVVLEAQASGFPAIVSDQGGPPEIVARRKSGLVVPAGRSDALTAAMRLAEDAALRAELAERAVQTARDHSWDAALAHF